MELARAVSPYALWSFRSKARLYVNANLSFIRPVCGIYRHLIYTVSRISNPGFWKKKRKMRDREPERWRELWEEIWLSSMNRIYYHIHPITPIKSLIIRSDDGSIAFNISWSYLELHLFFQWKLEEFLNLMIQLLQQWRADSMVHQLYKNNILHKYIDINKTTSTLNVYIKMRSKETWKSPHSMQIVCNFSTSKSLVSTDASFFMSTVGIAGKRVPTTGGSWSTRT